MIKVKFSALETLLLQRAKTKLGERSMMDDEYINEAYFVRLELDVYLKAMFLNE
mgnify:CR=1 FL=1